MALAFARPVSFCLLAAVAGLLDNTSTIVQNHATAAGKFLLAAVFTWNA